MVQREEQREEQQQRGAAEMVATLMGYISELVLPLLVRPLVPQTPVAEVLLLGEPTWHARRPCAVDLRPLQP